MEQPHHRISGLLLVCALSMFSAGDLAAAEPKAPLIDDVAVKLEPCEGFPYVQPGAKGKVSFLFTSKATRDLKLTWKVQTTLPSGKAPDIEHQLVLPKGGTKRIPMPDQVTALRGVASFAWQLTDQDGRSLALKDNLGVMTLPGPESTHRSSFRYGWGNGLVHFVAQPGEDKQIPLYAKMGIDLIRVGDRWAFSETRGDATRANANNNYWVDSSQIIDACKGTGMDILYVMWGTPTNLYRKGFSNESRIPELAAKNNTDIGLMNRVRPPDPAAWKVRVRDTVTKFKENVKFWEIWNDQDRYNDGSQHMPNGWVGNVDEYLEILRDGSKIIREIDPNLKVLSGGCFTIEKTPKHDLNPDMQARIVHEAQDAFDIHGTFDTNPALLSGPMAELRKAFKSPKPLWITRIEQKGAGDNPAEIIRRLLSARGLGASSFVWMWPLNFDSGYRGVLMPMNSWKTKDRKAINVHSYFQIMPASCSYVHAIGMLRMLTASTRIITNSPGQWLFSFSDPSKKDPRQVVGFWHDEKIPDSTVKLRVGPNAKCSLVDLYGNSEALTVSADGSVQVTLKFDPAYLTVTGGNAIAMSR